MSDKERVVTDEELLAYDRSRARLEELLRKYKDLPPGTVADTFRDNFWRDAGVPRTEHEFPRPGTVANGNGPIAIVEESE